MSLRALIRWMLFALYASAFFTIPCTILWAFPGFCLGIALSALFLLYLGFRGSDRIASRLKVTPLNIAHYPQLFAITREYCRRIDIPMPRLGVIESPSLNIAVFGFSHRSVYLVLTSGALQNLPRDVLAALLGRQLSYLWHGFFPCDAWLCQTLHALDNLIAPLRPRVSTPIPRFFSFRLFLRQILFYPMLIFPSFVLKSPIALHKLDSSSTLITKLPLALGEGFRLLQAKAERFPLRVPFSTRHLFLLPPQPKDPLARLFFDSDDLPQRIKMNDKLRQPVSIS